MPLVARSAQTARCGILEGHRPFEVKQSAPLRQINRSAGWPPLPVQVRVSLPDSRGPGPESAYGHAYGETRSVGELKDNLAFAHHAELIAREPFDGACVVLEQLGLVLEGCDLTLELSVAVCDAFELRAQLQIARDALAIDQPQWHGHAGDDQQTQRDDPCPIVHARNLPRLSWTVQFAAHDCPLAVSLPAPGAAHSGVEVGASLVCAPDCVLTAQFFCSCSP